MRDILLDLINNRKLSNLLYNNLDDNEKQQFDRLYYFSKVKDQVGSGDFSREKETNNEWMFLKYQLLSGNNGTETLEKAKTYINRFLKENKLQKEDAHEMLTHINQIFSFRSK